MASDSFIETRLPRNIEDLVSHFFLLTAKNES